MTDRREPPSARDLLAAVEAMASAVDALRAVVGALAANATAPHAADAAEMLSKHDALRLFGVPLRTFEAAARSGKLPAFKVGRRLVARREDVETWIASRRVQPRPIVADDATDDPDALYAAAVATIGRRARAAR